MSGGPELKKSLTQRQLSMIAMGGVIGAGLFVGSGAVLESAGPGAFITYLMCGALIILVMRMLAEMAVANPSTGSFADYARQALGNWAGFSVGWLYWYFWVIVVGFEAVAGGQVMQYWLPDVPVWIFALILMTMMMGTNLISVSSFGAFEFWFAGIKVAAIIVFLVLGVLFIFGLWPDKAMDFSNLTANGGFMPNGTLALTTAIVTVIFSMVGAEIATVAAAESADPERAVAKAANSVITRICVFFVGSMFVLAVILPWNYQDQVEGDGLAASPYVAALQSMDIPGADHIMNAIVLTAVLSCLNSGLYTASRMIFVLAGRSEAPASLVTVTGRGVPRNAILASSLVGFISVVFAAIWPETVFTFLLNSSGAVILFVYLLISISQIVLRYRTDDSTLTVKMWLFPFLSILAALAIVGILVQMFFYPDSRTQITLSLLSWAVVLLLFVVNRARIGRAGSRAGTGPSDSSGPDQQAARILVVANETVGADELIEELTRLDANFDATYRVVVPASPVDTGAAATHGALNIREATQAAAQERLDRTLAILTDAGLEVAGGLGDYRPLRAIKDAIASFDPDRIVIATLPASASVWQRFEVVDQARALGVPLTHIEAESMLAPTP